MQKLVGGVTVTTALVQWLADIVLSKNYSPFRDAPWLALRDLWRGVRLRRPRGRRDALRERRAPRLLLLRAGCWTWESTESE